MIKCMKWHTVFLDNVVLLCKGLISVCSESLYKVGHNKGLAVFISDAIADFKDPIKNLKRVPAL